MISKTDIDNIFEKLIAIRPATNFDEQKIINAKRVWHEYLNEFGVTHEMIHNGFRRCALQNSPYFPSVGEFVNWCRTIPEIDSVHESLREALKFAHGDIQQVHPVIYHAVRMIGSHELKNMSQTQALKQWESAMKRAKERFFEGSLPQMPALEAPKPEVIEKHEPADPEFAKAQIQKLRDIVKSEGSERDE